MNTQQGKRNRLQHEKSPYLLQHAANPVDWFPWGDEAFETAARLDRPIFLSIGYSTCHWCHVMERESFEDDEVAALLNEHFVCIKVDREERPDIDSVYMSVCQLMSPSCGWPLTILMTPDKKPFFASTYIPKENRYNRPGMLEMLPRVTELWTSQRGQVLGAAERMTQALQQFEKRTESGELGESVLRDAFGFLERTYDDENGGFGSAPKFPTPHTLFFLLRYWRRLGERRALEMVTKTLVAMRHGGIFDQIGFGFHRYSTDAHWLLPHFEKMLYDQAMLAMAYIEAHQATGDKELATTAREIFSYVLRDLVSREGAFFSAEDADSEGVEGKFYLWSEEEIRDLLDDEADLFIAAYGIEPEGNFLDEASKERTGANIPYMRRPLVKLAKEQGISEMEASIRLDVARQRLLAQRGLRTRPYLDDKVLTDWNGLMIAALAKGAQAFGDSSYATVALRAADFILEKMRDSEGRLLHRFRDGEAGIPAYADDYAFLIWGLIELYQATFEERYLGAAIELNSDFIARFWDGANGGFYFTAKDSEELLMRRKEGYDGAVPSANSVAMLNLVRLARITGDNNLEAHSAAVARALSGDVANAPAAHTQFLCALDFALGPAHEVVIAGGRDSADIQAMLGELRKRFLPSTVIVLRPEEDDAEISRIAPHTASQRSIGGDATAYVCCDGSCGQPTTNTERMLESLGIEAGARNTAG